MPLPDPLVLQDDSDGIDDPNSLIGLAMHDDFVFEPLGARGMEIMFFGEAVVPAAVPGHEQVSVLLPCVGELRTGERLDVEIAVGVGVGGEIGLRLCATDPDRKRRCGRNE